MRQFILMSFMLAISSFLFAGNPPETVNKAFKQKFPNAVEIKWGKEGAQEWEANFKLDGINMSSNFNNSGEWLETETEIAASKIPDKIIMAINNSYKNCKIVSGAIIERLKASTIYEVDIKIGAIKKEVLYNLDGSSAK
jgi:hypothetical protein